MELPGLVRVQFEGGALDGDVNEQDYMEDGLEVGAIFDWPTRGLRRGGVGAADTRERYVLEERSTGWVFAHAGQVVPPVEDQAFEATVVGGPENGKVVYILGTARRDVGRRMNHLAQGCVLHYDGDDPTLGWELRYQDDADPAV
ncbi:hypothetical protein AB4305_00070 [Nocardia sp. 2YAB30]|uniref:hypothetical protein n=1 Tax=unclassified Nocardia TaxID=2637762 RepID=UPI003F9E249B